MSDIKEILTILNDNRKVGFVRRIIAADKFPVMDNDDGTVSTHSMAWGEDENGTVFVYPTVVLTEDGELERLDDDDAFDNAMATDNFIQFGSREKADWFSKNYKRAWEVMGVVPGSNTGKKNETLPDSTR